MTELSHVEAATATTATPLLNIRDLVVTYGSLRANDGVSLKVPEGATLAVIGESGCGKSTLGKAVSGLVSATSGDMAFDGHRLGEGKDPAASAGGLGIQLVLQDPMAALNPRWPIWRSVAEPRRRFKEPTAAARELALSALEEVAIGRHLAERRPRQLSGGQRQRVTIARALAADPRLVVLDEAVSALDVSVRNEVLVLLQELKERRGLTYLFISHDISVVTQCATHVAVMYLGKVVEAGTVEQVVRGRLHPYTRALLSAVPTLDHNVARRVRLDGELPSAADPPSGCRFRTRCPYVQSDCEQREPELVIRASSHPVACHHTEDVIDVQVVGDRSVDGSNEQPD